MQPTTVLRRAFLAASTISLTAVVVGAWIAHRAGRGENPIPSLPRPVKVIGRGGGDKPPGTEKAKVELPDVRA